MNAPAPKADKPLVPFILFFGFVILLTIVITNMREGRAKPGKDSVPQNATGLALSPVRGSQLFDNFRRQDSRPEQTAGTLSPKELGALVDRASLMIANGALKEAEELLRTAYVFHPSSPKILSLLGSLMLEESRYQEAELFYRAFTKASPEDASSFIGLANAFAGQSKYTEAIACVESSLLVNPDSGSAYLLLAGLDARTGNDEQAVECLKKAYSKLGERLVPLSADSRLDKLRELPEFKEVIEKARHNLPLDAPLSLQDALRPQEAPLP